MDQAIKAERNNAPRFSTDELRFIDAYMADPQRNADKASQSIGFAGNQSVRFLEREHVLEEIAYREKKRLCRNAISVEKAVNWLVQIVGRCMQKTKVVDKQGKSTGMYRFMPTQAIKGIELILKVLGAIGGSDKVDKTDENGQRLTIGTVMPVIIETQKALHEMGMAQPMFIMNSAGESLMPDAEAIEDKPVDVPPEDVLQVPMKTCRNIDEYMANLKNEVAGGLID